MDVLRTGVTRRELIRRSARFGLALPVMSALLAACGGSDSTETGDSGSASQDSGTTTQTTTTEGEGSGGSDSSEGSGGGGKDELVVGWMFDILSLDPAQMRDTLDTELGYKIYSSLACIRTGAVDELVGDLATSWEISSDGTVYTFELEPSAKWHRDYGPVTAADVKYSFMRHKDESVQSLYATEAEPIKDVQVVDDHTVEVIMEKPYPGFLLEFAAYRPGFIVNEKAIEDGGDRYNEQPIGSGPFMLEHWSPQEKVELVRNDDYYGEAGPFRKVTYMVIPQEATLEIALEKGEIDIAYFFNPETQARLTEHPMLKTASITGPRTYYLQLNLESPPLDDVRVRQALWWAIDKDALVEGVMLGQGEATDTLLNPHVFARLDERPYSYDPEKAKELLAEAGYPDGFETTLLIYDTELIPDLATAIQDMWRKIGVQAELVQREWAQHVEVRRSGNFDIGLQPQLRLGPDQYVTPLMHSSSAPYPNAARYSNPETDALIDEARVTVDDAKREALYHEIQTILHRDVPVIPLVHPVFVLAFQPNIQGAVPGLITLNVTEMSVSD